MIKNWQTNFEGNIVADSSMPRGAWVGSCKCSSSLCRLFLPSLKMCCTDSGPVGDMTFSRNVYWNSTGYCGKGWPATDAHFVAPPHSPTGLGDNFISGNYALDNGIVQNEMGVGYLLRGILMSTWGFFPAVFRPFRTVFPGLGAGFLNLGGKTEGTAKKRGKNGKKWARNGLKRVGVS